MINHVMCIAGLVTVIFVPSLQYGAVNIITTRPMAGNRIAMNRTGQQQEPQQEAARVWEQAIAAKGGRERLYSVRNMVISSSEVYTTHLGEKNKVRVEELFVFPNKVWIWQDYRPDVFGLVVTMYNYDTRMSYAITPPDPHHPPEPIGANQRSESQMYGLVSFLLETRWLKPTLVRASTGRVKGKAVDIIETKINNQRVDFAFDRETHLPLEVSYYSTDRNKTFVNVQELSDYLEVNGIRIPQKVKVKEGPENKINIQFNVEYNEEIFIRPPALDAGPEAWRLKAKK